jgi:hypothetical protein
MLFRTYISMSLRSRYVKQKLQVKVIMHLEINECILYSMQYTVMANLKPQSIIGPNGTGFFALSCYMIKQTQLCGSEVNMAVPVTYSVFCV